MQTVLSTWQKIATGAPGNPSRKGLRVPRNPARRGAKGFTLIELMITVAIIAILMAIAIPSYRSYILQSHRSAAKTALLDLASREEKYYATNNAYDNTLVALGYSSVSGSPASIQVPNNSNEDYYSVSVSVTAATATTPATFTATAAPTTASGQSSDSCGSYYLTNLGAQTNSGTTSNGSCW
jgi:type IV pilus assembly protein PilE